MSNQWGSDCWEPHKSGERGSRVPLFEWNSGGICAQPHYSNSVAVHILGYFQQSQRLLMEWHCTYSNRHFIRTGIRDPLLMIRMGPNSRTLCHLSSIFWIRDKLLLWKNSFKTTTRIQIYCTKCGQLLMQVIGEGELGVFQTYVLQLSLEAV